MIKFCNYEFKRNGVLASGILGVTSSSLLKVASSGAGGITTKSISKNPRKGHPTPVVQAYEHGVINAVGLSSPGLEEINKELKDLKSKTDSIVIASVFGSTASEFRETIEGLDINLYDIIELNISCPNVASEFGLSFAASKESTREVVTESRKATKKPIIVKLSANFGNIGQIAKICEDNGADGITAINTIGPGMLIDINTFKPKLSNKEGGVSGPAILPVAIRSIYEIRKNTKLPIIGMGGITNFEDALQIIMAGATLYGVGTGILYKGLEIFNEINSKIDNFLKEKKISYEEIIGISHKT